MFYNGDCVIYTNSNRNKSLYGVVQPMMLPILNSNICVFKVKIKVNEGKTFCFQIKKYDNVFITFRNFCMYNNIPPYFYKPILIQIFLAMNRTFELFNSDVNKSNAMLPIETIERVMDLPIIGMIKESSSVQHEQNYGTLIDKKSDTYVEFTNIANKILGKEERLKKQSKFSRIINVLFNS